MKILAYTPSGGSIVEFGKSETELLEQLKTAMEGRDWQPKAPRGHPIDGDMEKAFLAIIYFIETKFSINAIRHLVDELDESIGIK